MVIAFPPGTGRKGNQDAAFRVSRHTEDSPA